MQTEDGASIKSDPIHVSQSVSFPVSDPPVSDTFQIPASSLNEHTNESIIDGIAHLVNANTDIGFKQCIAFGFDDDPRIRAIFMEVFSRVLKRGTRFDTRDTLKLGSEVTRLCEVGCALAVYLLVHPIYSKYRLQLVRDSEVRHSVYLMTTASQYTTRS
jgi:hypothetical protein